MLESLVASLLNRFLGSYVQNFDPKQLNIGIWGGDVKLRNLELKKEALDKFRLPVDVIEGHLGELVLQIPWSNLKNKPVKVLIEDVFLLAKPQESGNYNAEEEEKRAHDLKMEKLANLELLEQSPPTNGLSAEEIQKNQSFTESLVSKIVDNLQITIKNIHLRYEDSNSVQSHPFSLGFSLAELSAVSTDTEWNPIFIQNVSTVTRKLATLSSLSIYWDTDSKSILSEDYLSGQSTAEKFKALIPRVPPTDIDTDVDVDVDAENQNEASFEKSIPDHQYILRPVSGVGRILLNKQVGPTEPKTRAQFVFEELGFVFDDDQYRDALWTAELFRLYMKTKDFKKFRPEEPVKENPRAWLKYAANVVVTQIHERKREWSWDYISAKREERIRYVDLYKTKLRSGTLDVAQKQELDDLEWEASYEDIRFYRSLAKSELRKEKAPISTDKAVAPAQQASTWTSWFWGSANGSPEADPNAGQSDDPQEPVTLTEEQRKELYDAIEWDDNAGITPAADIPEDWVTLEIETALKKGSFTVRHDPHGKCKDVASIIFNGFRAKFFQRPNSFVTNISLEEFRVDDKSEQTLYEQIVTVKNLSHGDEHIELDSGNHNGIDIDGPEDVFFWLSFESNPLDKNADSNLFLRTKSITVFYNTEFIESLVAFFRPPQTHLETIGAIMNAAGSTVEGLRDQTRLGLEYVLQEHKTVNIKLDMKAPLIVIPLDHTSWTTPCAVIDAGHISLVSDLVKKEVLNEVKNKQTHKYTDSDWKQLESLMYDKFKLQLHDTQILIGASVRETMRVLHSKELDHPAYVLARADLDFLLEVSILPDAHSLTKFKVSGMLPLFKAAMSDRKYKLMMELIDKAIPNFGESYEEETPAVAEEDDHMLTGRDRSYSKAARPLYEEFVDVEDSDSDSNSTRNVTPSTAAPTSVSASTAVLSPADQKIFEFKFDVEKVELSLHRCTNDKTLAEDLLIDLVLEDFSLDYYYKTMEMFAHVTLGRLNVEDYIDKSSPVDLRRIVTSDKYDSSSGTTPRDLFDVKYNRIKRESTVGTPQEISDQIIQISLSTLNFVVAPKTFLTLLDFIITTFTSPADPNDQNMSQGANLAISNSREKTPDNSDSKVDAESAANGGEISVDVNLSSIIVTLNDDGIKLATLKLDTADVGVRLFNETMKIQAKMGSLALHDEVNEGTSQDSVLRKLISIEDSDLADFKYETFEYNPNNQYDASVYFHAGSIRINVVEEPFSRIVNFMSRFQQMKALYDRAREAAMNQANQIDVAVAVASKIHFDVLVKTPIVVYPRPVSSHKDGTCDILTSHLGEIFIYNDMTEKEVAPGVKALLNNIKAGLRSVKMETDFYFLEKDLQQQLEIIDDVDITFDLVHTSQFEGIKDPSMSIKGTMSDVKVNLTDIQYRYFLDGLSAVSRIFSNTSGMGEEERGELIEELKHNKKLESQSRSRSLSQSLNNEDDSKATKQSNDKIKFAFTVGTVSLVLYHSTHGISTENINDASLSKFSLTDFGIDFALHGDDSLESDLHVHSFTVHDTRAVKDNKFSEIIPSVNHDEHQFMCRVTRTSDAKRTSALLSIDSPRMILAIDYLFALKSFLATGISEIGIEEVDDSDLDALSGEECQEDNDETKFFLNLNIVDASIIVLANPSLSNTEAIVLKTEQFVVSQTETITLSVSKVGIFLCNMDKFEENRLRIIDDFSVSAALDQRGSSVNQLMTSIQIAVQPIVLRLSVRDVLLALSIMQKVSRLASTENDEGISTATDSTVGTTSAPSTKTGGGDKSTTTGRRTANKTLNSSSSSTKTAVAVVKGEELTADMDGMRFVLIGSSHELPMLDTCVKPFTVHARDWSSDLRIDASTEIFTNIYNLSKSAWEPLVETWDLGFHLARASLKNNTFVDIFSRKLIETTITSQTIDTLIGMVDFVSSKQQDGDEFLLKPREPAAPYRVRNETGFKMEVSIDGGADRRTEVVEDGQEIPWQFCDWHELRENLSTDIQNMKLAIQLVDSPYAPVRGIPVTSEGEELYILSSKSTKMTHRLACTIKLENNLKTICFRSTYAFVNDTNVALEICADPDGTIWRLEPKQSRAIALQDLEEGRPIMVRPSPELNFKWCQTGIDWRSLLESQGQSSSLVCKSSENPDVQFYIQADARYDHSIPLTRIYPYMTVVLSAPFEIVNLLPYDFEYRLYCKDTKKDWSNMLKKGERSPVHVVSKSALLLLSVHVAEAGYDKSEFAVINSPRGSDGFRREDTILTHSRDGQRLKLRIHYSYDSTKVGNRIEIFSPYVVLNRIGLDLQVATRVNTAISRVRSYTVDETVASVTHITNRELKNSRPLMWSFDNYGNTSNRALLKVGNSRWSDPLSLEAIGTFSEVKIPSHNRQSNVHVGMTILEGEGKYKLSKIITISPRFVICNKLSEEVQFRDPDVVLSDALIVGNGEIKALHQLRNGETKLIASFTGPNSQWSAPFDVNSVGRTFVKLYRKGKGFVLVNITILMEQATLFLHLEDSSKNWPYSLRNFTDFEFIFYQANPYIDEQGVEVGNHAPFTPIKYRVPAKSVMPYSWDFPAAPLKELVLSCNGRERRIQLAEIGSLPPMKIPRVNRDYDIRPTSPSKGGGGIVDLDVVADGPLISLVITNYDPATSMYQLKRKQQGNSSSANVTNSTAAINSTSSITGSSTEVFAVVDEDQEDQDLFNVRVNFEGLGVSLINRKLVELCYITLRGFEFHFKSSELYDTFSMKMKWMQIDNQLFGSLFPVVLFPSVIPNSSKEINSHPTFSTSITRVKDDTHGVLFIKYFTVLLQQMTLEIDEDFLFSVMDFIKTPSQEQVDKLCDESLEIPQPIKDNTGIDVYFETLHLQPAQLDLSFMRTERINVEDRVSSQNALMFFLNMLTMAIGNINDAPVQLNALMLENVHTPLPLLMQVIGTHYSQEFIYQIHKILGSADFIGNPVGLFNNLSSGFMDIFYEPYLGYIHSDRPQDLGIGIAKGGVSFMKKSVFGISNSVSKITGSISKGLAVATMDKEFQNRRLLKSTSRNKPRHALYGIASGATSFVEGLSSGVSGLALYPLEGATKEGTAGFFKGLGKGLVGLPTKTAIGFFDMANNVSEGVRNTTTVFDTDQIARVRAPRFIEHDGIIRPYSEREAVGQAWLKAANNGAYFDDEYLAHLPMTRENVAVIVTFNRIIMLATSNLTTEWEVDFRDLQTIVMERTGIALILRGGVQGPFVPIADTDSRRYIYKQMGIAVNEYNRKHQTLT